MPDRTLLVTGAGRGMGAATAIAGARAGRKVGVNYVADETSPQAVVSAIEATGGRAATLRDDVTDEASVERLLDELACKLGLVSHLVNTPACRAVSAAPRRSTARC
jgi:NAD(P)-dependent dehydrogenase (short-subunit alcohol dehydrogenase family)